MSSLLFLIAIAISSLFIYWLLNRLHGLCDKLVPHFENWLKKHKTIKHGLVKILNAFFIIFIIWILGIATVGITEWVKSYKTAYQKRIDFLHANCDLIDEGYEVLNNGKSTYRCPNGKEYKEYEK